MVIEKRKDETNVNDAEQEVDPGIQKHHINILDRIFPGIAWLFADMTEKKFQTYHY